MKRPETVLSLKDGVNKLVQNPRKGLYYLLGTDKAKAPFLWLKATDFTQDEERVLREGAQLGFQEGRVYWDADKARPVFCSEKAVSQTFTTMMVKLCREPGGEKLKTARYRKVEVRAFGEIVNRGAAALPVEEEVGISDEVAEGVGAMIRRFEGERLEKARTTQGILAGRLKREAGRLKGVEGLREAVLAASEAGTLLRGKEPDVDRVEHLLAEAIRKLQGAEQAAASRPTGPDTPIPSSSSPPVVDDEEGEDVDEDESGSPQPSLGNGYDPSTGQYKGRPAKPTTLSGKDENGAPLTAHHIYPWNKLRSDLNAALLDPTGDEMRKVLAFAVHTPPEGFYDELAKPRGEREPAFVGWVNQAARALCWGPSNIFMGPLNTNRGDDPGSKLDTSYAKSGVPTPSSALGELLDRDGGIAHASALTEMLARNVRDAQTGEDGGRQAIGYDPLEWVMKDGKKVRRGKVALDQTVVEQTNDGKVEQVVTLSSPDDPGWKATDKKPQGGGIRAPMTEQDKEEARRQGADKRTERANRTVEEFDFSSGGLFGEEEE